MFMSWKGSSQVSSSHSTAPKAYTSEGGGGEGRKGGRRARPAGFVAPQHSPFWTARRPLWPLCAASRHCCAA
jgi:hypothetical protein